MDCTSFGRPAETINKYLRKGRPVFVEGRLSFSSWVGQDGAKRSKLKVIVENFQFLGGSKADESASGRNQADSQQGQSRQDTGDDIPF